MERVNAILKHSSFQYHVNANNAAEANRRFCCHNVGHFLDVARIGQIMNLEEGLKLSKEWIYAAALLHDLGRHVQYETGVPHEIPSGEFAPEILKDCGFNDSETRIIVEAILHHRDGDVKEERNLRGLLYRADKASRACYGCKVEQECNWKGEKKNLVIKY